MRWFLSAEQRVENGATALDAEFIEWQDHVSPTTLNIMSGGDCVLGQLYGRYDIGINHLCVDPQSHGFFVGRLPRRLCQVFSIVLGLGMVANVASFFFGSFAFVIAGLATMAAGILGLCLANSMYDADAAALEAHWTIAITERRIAALIVPVAVQDAHGSFVNDGYGNVPARI